MHGLLSHLIQAIIRIWHADNELRDSSSMTAGSEFDKAGRRSVALFCGGFVILLIILDIVWWWLKRSQ